MPNEKAPLPWLDFYTRDWMLNPRLSMCETATRGIWIDAISQMHIERTGTLRGTAKQLAKRCRCTPEEMDRAAADLRDTNAADVTIDSNGIITLVSRRRNRDEKRRNDAALRQDRFRQSHTRNKPVTLHSSEYRVQNTDLTATTLSKSPQNGCDDSGRLSGLPDPPQAVPSKRKQKGEARSAIAVEIYEAYPKRVGKASALKAIDAAIKRGADPEHLKQRTALYAEYIAKWPKHRRKFVPMPATWFNGERYDDNEQEWEHVEERRGGPIGPCGKIGDFKEVEKKGWDA